MNWLLGLGFLCWTGLLWKLDRLTTPSWVARDCYKLICWLQWGVLGLLLVKAVTYHTELVILNRICQ